jgi:hypothetical protein
VEPLSSIASDALLVVAVSGRFAEMIGTSVVDEVLADAGRSAIVRMPCCGNCSAGPPESIGAAASQRAGGEITSRPHRPCGPALGVAISDADGPAVLDSTRRTRALRRMVRRGSPSSGAMNA